MPAALALATVLIAKTAANAGRLAQLGAVELGGGRSRQQRWRRICRGKYAIKFNHTTRAERRLSEQNQAEGPLPCEEMSPEDRELLEHPAADAVWDLLAKPFPKQPLTPDASVRLDLVPLERSHAA